MLNQLKISFRQIDRGLCLALLFSLLAAWAFILRPSLPRETDVELHVFRTAELGYALRAGVLYPRWAADFYYGYGYPIFNYYAPLTYYLANLLSLVLPGGAVFGVKAVFILGFICAGSGTYLLVRQLHNARAGLVATASYLFAPYIYLIDPHIRGDLAEFFALGIAPLTFYASIAFVRTHSHRNLIISTLLITSLIVTHNLLALVYFTMLTIYVMWITLIVPPIVGRPLRLPTDFLSLMPLILGLALAAFFWLPVALERNAVQLGNLIGPGHFDYRNHFLTLSELFAPSTSLDLGAVNPAFRFNLGLAQWLLAGFGMIMSLIAIICHCKNAPTSPRDSGTNAAPTSKEELAIHTLFWFLSFVLLTALMLPISQTIWDCIPLMAFLQFPWRLLGPAALCIAILGGCSAHLLDFIPSVVVRPYVLAALTALPLGLTLPIFIPPNWNNFGPSDQLAMLEFELGGFALGTTSTGDFLPVDVDLVPSPNHDLIASYHNGGPIDKINRHTLPDGATVRIIQHGPTASTLEIYTPEDFILRLYTFMFAGWRASIDGNQIEIEVAKPEGFITVPLPQGQHTVRVWLGTTPARTAAWLFSLGGSIALALLARRLSCMGHNTQAPNIDSKPLYMSLGVFVVVAALGAWAGLFQPRSTGTVALPADHRLHRHLQGGIDLIGFDLPVAEFEPGETVPVTLYWKAREPVPANYQVFVHLTSTPQHTWGQSDKLNPGDYPTTRWPLDLYVRDSHKFTIPLGTPPGDYSLRVGLWDHNTGIRQLGA